MTLLAASEQLILEILAALLARGVRRMPLALAELDPNGDRFEPELFGDALDWLRAEGVIRADLVRSHPPLAENAVLTARGFTLVQQGNGQQDNGRSGAKSALADAVARAANRPREACEESDGAFNVLAAIARGG